MAKNATMTAARSAEEMNLSDRETVAFHYLMKHGQATAEDLHNELESVDMKGSSVIMLVKYLSAKIAPHGYIISRTSGIGRGQKANFTIAKKF